MSGAHRIARRNGRHVVEFTFRLAQDVTRCGIPHHEYTANHDANLSLKTVEGRGESGDNLTASSSPARQIWISIRIGFGVSGFGIGGRGNWQMGTVFPVFRSRIMNFMLLPIIAPMNFGSG